MVTLTDPLVTLPGLLFSHLEIKISPIPNSPGYYDLERKLDELWNVLSKWKWNGDHYKNYFFWKVKDTYQPHDDIISSSSSNITESSH